MKRCKQIVSGFLSLSITSSICASGLPAALATNNISTDGNIQVKQSKATGDIGVKINFALPQTKVEVENRNVKINLIGNGKNITVDLAKSVNKDGIAVQKSINGDNIISYDVVFSNLEIGEYKIEITGDGYKTVNQTVILNGYSKQVIVSTDNGTFSLGDFDNSGYVDESDRNEFNKHLGSISQDDLNKYDLDGDGFIDITDLSYINNNIGLQGEAIVNNTNIISASFDSQDITDDENPEKIFSSENSEPVKFKPLHGSNISIPITLDEENGVDVSEIKITSPVGDGAVEGGTANVTYIDENGKEVTGSFDLVSETSSAAMPRGIRNTNENVLKINLGKKVAVKKVTITVTKNEGSADYASISKIEFLEDIAPTTPQDDTTKPKTISAKAGDASVSLIWSSVNNVTGYTVYYGTNKDSMNDKIDVTTNKATISGLKNGTQYYFYVVATSTTDVSWSGTPSNIVTATPKVATPPKGAPSNITLEAADQSIRASWSSVEDADRYQVFYRLKGEKEYIQFGGDVNSTLATITSLENGKEYEIAVKAGNKIGFSGLSTPATCTPRKESVGLPNLPTGGRIDNSEVSSITMADKGNVDRTLCPNFTVNDLIDNDAGTYWIAKNYWYDSNITYTFDKPQNMSYAVIVPYLNDRYKNRIENYGVVAKDENGNIVSQSSGYANLTKDDYIIVEFPYAENIKSLTIELGEKAGGPRVSISEIAFYESTNLEGNIANLFENDSFTKLKSDVTPEQITKLEQDLENNGKFYMNADYLRDELNLAKSLLNGDTSALGVVKSDFTSRSVENDNKNHGQSASSLQPIGVSAKAGTEIAIYAEIPDGEAVNIIPTQYYGESSVWKGEPIKLKNGRNYITVPKIGSLSDTRGGALYLTYSGSNADKIKIHVRGDKSSTFKTPLLDLSNWYNIGEQERKNKITKYISELQAYVDSFTADGIKPSNLPTSIRNATEIATPSVVLSLPASQVLNGLKSASLSGIQSMYSNVFMSEADVSSMTQAMYDNIMAWEEEMFVANMVQGIIPSSEKFDENYRYPMETRQNIRYMRMFAGAFMYAAGEHIGVGYDSCSGLVQGKPTSLTSGKSNGLFGWGIAHEIGHNMDKIGYAETTNNIYSLALQAWDGKDMTSHETRLTSDNRWEKIFDKVATSRKGMANDVFVQLGMYWQLHLAYDDAENPLDFYNEFFTKLKNGEYSNYTKDERIALIASEVANHDLSEFFTRWGMTLSDDVISKLNSYTDEKRAIWYMDDSSRNARLNDSGENAGETSFDISTNDNIVTLNITNDNPETIQGYEISRNGSVIGFTTSGKFEDNLGAANNLTYSYEVTPIDKRGNIGEKTDKKEVLISYDKTISKDQYDLETDDSGTITITMKNNNVVPVSGIKVTGAENGNVSVKVSNVYSAIDDTEFVVAKKDAELKSGTNIIYFNKPDTDPSDTRMWTYDTAVMKITGVPDGATVELLDYPGDKVDFYNGTSVGKLKNDYVYGDDVIEAGTLVVIGTYRGDPVYNYVKVKAKYNTTGEAAEANGTTEIERHMNGYSLMFAEIPQDGAVSDTSDGFFIFVPDIDAEKELNKQDGVTDDMPLEIKVELYRSTQPDSTANSRITSETLWISFPDEASIPFIELTGEEA